eukprot:968576-Prymnesium_polylepis.1
MLLYPLACLPSRLPALSPACLAATARLPGLNSTRSATRSRWPAAAPSSPRFPTPPSRVPFSPRLPPVPPVCGRATARSLTTTSCARSSRSSKRSRSRGGWTRCTCYRRSRTMCAAGGGSWVEGEGEGGGWARCGERWNRWVQMGADWGEVGADGAEGTPTAPAALRPHGAATAHPVPPPKRRGTEAAHPVPRVPQVTAIVYYLALVVLGA